MKKIILAVMTSVTGLVLLMSYRTSTEVVPPVVAADTNAESDTSATPTQPAASSGDPTQSSTPSAPYRTSKSHSASAWRTGTYLGSTVVTRHGKVQVKIKVTDAGIVSASAVKHPSSNNRDVSINARALPILNREVVKAQSAKIDMVSGATVTSEGYLTSLQRAIDKARA